MLRHWRSFVSLYTRIWQMVVELRVTYKNSRTVFKVVTVLVVKTTRLQNVTFKRTRKGTVYVS